MTDRGSNSLRRAAVRRRTAGVGGPKGAGASDGCPSAGVSGECNTGRDGLGHRASDARLEALLRTAVDAIVTVDARGIIRSVNPATERMFGYRVDELVGRNVSILMPSPHREEHDGHIARYLRTGEKRIIGIGREALAQRKDGSVFPVDLAISEVESGALFMGIIRDGSERKQADARARQADRMASIGTLAAGLGHDMNNVLLPVRARLSALRAAGVKGRIPGAECRQVEEIAKSIAYLQQLADGLHFLAMDPERGGGERIAMTDLHSWWGQTGPLLSKAVPKHVRVTATIPAGLPRASVAAHGLTQAVLNLVVNAGDAIPHGRKRRQGRVHLWAEVFSDKDGRRCVGLNVRDNGRGMTEEVKRRAFEIFFTTKPRGLGTGLGLPLVRRVVDQAGGSVEIESQQDHGTTVRLVFLVVAGAAVGKGNHGPLATISVQDGRARALLRHLLEAAGARVRADGAAGPSDIWVADPDAVTVQQAIAWRRRHPKGRLVLFGSPPESVASRWGPLAPRTIADREDLGLARKAIGDAVTGF